MLPCPQSRSELDDTIDFILIGGSDSQRRIPEDMLGLLYTRRVDEAEGESVH